MKNSSIEKLKQFLFNLPAGQVSQDKQSELIKLLTDCWHIFAGNDNTSMFAYKLKRIEEPHWEPPILSFRIERHGGLTMGSTRAEMQTWRIDIIDINNVNAVYDKIEYRQLKKRSTTFDVKPVAEELAKLIIDKGPDERLQWSTKTGGVQVLIGKVLSSSSKQTLDGRRKRLLKAMEEHLLPLGWKRSGSWWRK